VVGRLIESSPTQAAFEVAVDAALLSRRAAGRRGRGDILNPEEGDQNKSALLRLPSGRLGSAPVTCCGRGEGGGVGSDRRRSRATRGYS